MPTLKLSRLKLSVEPSDDYDLLLLPKKEKMSRRKFEKGSRFFKRVERELGALQDDYLEDEVFVSYEEIIEKGGYSR